MTKELFFDICLQVLSEGAFLNIVTVNPGGPKRVNPTMKTSTGTAKRKGDPQHYVEGKNNKWKTQTPNTQKCILMFRFRYS